MRMLQRAVVAVGDPERDAELLRYARLLRAISPGVQCHFEVADEFARICQGHQLLLLGHAASESVLTRVEFNRVRA